MAGGPRGTAPSRPMSTTLRPASAPPRRTDLPVELREAVPLAVAYAVCLALLRLHVDRAFGLPAHPLIVHVPVIAVPLLSLVSVVLAVRPALRERFALAWAGLALVALAGTVLAAGAGHALLASFGGGAPRGALATHVDLADLLEWSVALLTAVVLVVVVARRRLHGPADLAARALTLVLAVAAAYYVVRVGDAGARAVWARG